APQPPPAAPVPRLEDLGGLFQTQDSVPTDPARKVYEQVRIVDGAVYLFDPKSNAWIKLEPQTVYGGIVDPTGAAISLPSGWTSARSAKGNYVITHNFGTTDYSVNPTIDATADPTHNIAITVLLSKGANSFTVNTINLLDPIANAPRDFDYTFNFILK